MYDLFTDSLARDRILPKIDNPELIEFWEKYERRTSSSTAAAKRKIGRLIKHPRLGPILSARKSNFDADAIIRESKIVVIDLSTGSASQEVNIVLGTDAGDTYVFAGSGVHDELSELVKAGLSPAEALGAATLRSAEFLSLEDDYGSIEPGKRADLVLVRANPLEDIAAIRQIELVMLGGTIWSRADLDQMLADVEARVGE